ncbi:putative polysaccharide biosynthesis protein [Halobacillus litoralis]|uniref:putative polysaccharide biosynthesis protein n=1 Tax=Halobacillus litoralis TaxID=45668 RepID=UPI002491A095|nr:polysaccharide biosynthesis protein [Halobacillus litoralis]
MVVQTYETAEPLEKNACSPPLHLQSPSAKGRETAMKSSLFLKSTLILTIATLTSKLLGSLFRVPLQNIAGDEVLGIFSLVYPVYMVALILSVAGIPIAISKLIAEARSSGTEADIHHIQKTARILALLLGISSMGFLLVFSHPISQMIGGSATEPSLIVVSFTLLVAPYMAVDRGYFQGFEDMRPTAISQVIEQFIRVLIILAAAYALTAMDYNDTTIAAGIMIGSFIGATASLIYLKNRLQKSTIQVQVVQGYSFSIFKKWGKKILSVSLPIAIGTLTMALFNVVDSVTVPYNLQAHHGGDDQVTFLYGIYGRGLALVQIATVFATSVILPLIPSLTKHVNDGELKEAGDLIETTRGLTHVLSWPVAILLIVLTVPINIALFTDTEGSLMISIVSLSSAFISLTLVGTAILQGMNATRIAATIILGGAAVKGISNFLFVPVFGIEGAALGSLVTYMLVVIINRRIIQQRIQLNPDHGNIAKVIGTATMLGGITALTYLFIEPSEWSRGGALLFVVLASFTYMILYGFSLLQWKAIDQRMLQQVPFLSKWKR